MSCVSGLSWIWSRDGDQGAELTELVYSPYARMAFSHPFTLHHFLCRCRGGLNMQRQIAVLSSGQSPSRRAMWSHPSHGVSRKTGGGEAERKARRGALQEQPISYE